MLENTDEVRHDLMIPGLNPIFALNVIGPDDDRRRRFVTPDEDVTLFLHCHVPAHDKVGMVGKLVVGQGGETEDARAAATRPASRRECSRASASVIATAPARRPADRQPRGDYRASWRPWR